MAGVSVFGLEGSEASFQAFAVEGEKRKKR